MTRGTVDAVVEALARPTIGNRGHFPAVHGAPRRPREPETRSSQVVTVQPAVYGWACDTCRACGFGGMQLLWHTVLIGHRRFSPRGR